MKGIKKMIANSIVLDKRVKKATQNLRVLANTERSLINDQLVISQEIARKLKKMVTDEDLKKFIQMPIADDDNKVIPGWDFLSAATQTAICIKNKGYLLGVQPAAINIHLFNGNQSFFLKSEETIAGLNKCWKGYASVDYVHRAGNNMVVTFKLAL